MTRLVWIMNIENIKWVNNWKFKLIESVSNGFYVQVRNNYIFSGFASFIHRRCIGDIAASSNDDTPRYIKVFHFFVNFIIFSCEKICYSQFAFQ